MTPAGAKLLNLIERCGFHDEHDPDTLDPHGPGCQRAAVAWIHWRDGSVSSACEAHGVCLLSPELRARVERVSPVPPYADAAGLADRVAELEREAARAQHELDEAVERCLARDPAHRKLLSDVPDVLGAAARCDEADGAAATVAPLAERAKAAAVQAERDQQELSAAPRVLAAAARVAARVPSMLSAEVRAALPVLAVELATWLPRGADDVATLWQAHRDAARAADRARTAARDAHAAYEKLRRHETTVNERLTAARLDALELAGVLEPRRRLCDAQKALAIARSMAQAAAAANHDSSTCGCPVCEELRSPRPLELLAAALANHAPECDCVDCRALAALRTEATAGGAE